MGEIKSAFEKAMERVEKLGKASEQDTLRWKYHPEGEKLGARFLKDEVHLIPELGKCEEKARPYVIEGVLPVLIRNIDLPRNEQAKRGTKTAMEGIKTLKSDKGAVENVYSKMRRIFNHYENEGEQQRRQALESFKRDFQAKLQQALQQQFGAGARLRANAVETHPQFQEEWRHVLIQLDSQYLKLLDEFKVELNRIP